MGKPRQPRVEKICESCGKPFSVMACEAHYRKNCSAACRTQAAMTIYTCKWCGKEFQWYKFQERTYCSRSCRAKATAAGPNAAHKVRKVSFKGENNPMYGVHLTGEKNHNFGMTKEKHPQYKGRTIVNGYYRVLAPDDHPCREGRLTPDGRPDPNVYIAEHRLIMDQMLGRYLTDEEVVHHINGNPLDNRPENLELFASTGEHHKVAHPTRGNQYSGVEHLPRTEPIERVNGIAIHEPKKPKEAA